MRAAFCNAMIELAAQERYFFLTGDLGFMALEPLRDVLGDRFINAGVAEQNMVSVAAGMARVGAKPWVYSIAPFCYARPFEQIRNDLCLNRLGVRLVGNGGGYAYGSMGATHHALEDYGVLLTLAGMRAYIPAFDADVRPIVQAMSARRLPCYLRLGRSELEDERPAPPYAPWRRLQDGDGGVLIAAGPAAGGLWRALRDRPVADRPALWSLSELDERAFEPPRNCSRPCRGRASSRSSKSTWRRAASASGSCTFSRSAGGAFPPWCMPTHRVIRPDAMALKPGIGVKAGSTCRRFSRAYEYERGAGA